MRMVCYSSFRPFGRIAEIPCAAKAAHPAGPQKTPLCYAERCHPGAFGKLQALWVIAAGMAGPRLRSQALRPRRARRRTARATFQAQQQDRHAVRGVRRRCSRCLDLGGRAPSRSCIPSLYGIGAYYASCFGRVCVEGRQMGKDGGHPPSSKLWRTGRPAQ